MQTVHSQIDHGTLTGLYDLVFHLLLHLRYHLLDTSRMDTSVLYQLMQGQTSDLTTNRVESRKNDSLRRIIHHDLNTGSGLQSTDITSLTTDDTAFDLVRFNMEHGIEFSIAVSVATRWIDWITIFFASLLAVIFASSTISLM